MLVEQVPRRKWKLAFWPVAFHPHWRFGQWHTVHCRYDHWHFSIGVLSGNISGTGILGYGVLSCGVFIACDFFSIMKIGEEDNETFLYACITLFPAVKRENSYINPFLIIFTS